MLCDDSRKALEEKIHEGDLLLNDVLAKLAKSLGEYGFKGSVKLQLTVTLVDSAFGEEHTTLERITSLKFKR